MLKVVTHFQSDRMLPFTVVDELAYTEVSQKIFIPVSAHHTGYKRKCNDWSQWHPGPTGSQYMG
jgi:hypothetical protein